MSAAIYVLSNPAFDSLYSMEVVGGNDSLFCAQKVKILHLKIQGSLANVMPAPSLLSAAML